MPGWIPLMQNVFSNRRIVAVANAIAGGDVEKTVGHLTRLWTWAFDHAEDGDLSHLSNQQIARAANWPLMGINRGGDRFVDALIQAGLLVETKPRLDGDGAATQPRRARLDGVGLQLHDWDDYVGRLLDRRTKDRERKRKEREETRIHAALLAESHGQSNGQSAGQRASRQRMRPLDGPRDVRTHRTEHDRDRTVGTPFATRTLAQPAEADSR